MCFSFVICSCGWDFFELLKKLCVLKYFCDVIFKVYVIYCIVLIVGDMMVRVCDMVKFFDVDV